MIKELDVVTLTRDVQEPQLPKGSKGAVVHCYSDGQGFEVEFVQETGETIAVLTLEHSDIQQFEEPKVTLQPTQIKILQAIQDGKGDSDSVAIAVNLSTDTVEY